MYKRYSEKILLANRVPFQRGLYVVGPFSGRVSFSSQQKRAINLIWSVDSEIKASGDAAGLKDKNVAVIGAGVAGLTCSLALTAFQASVKILEADHKPMHRQIDTDHRDIHPSINAWPFEMIEPTTSLPFLNWYQDACHEVVKRIQRKWDAITDRPENSNFKRIVFGCPINEIKMVKGQWLTISETCNDENYNENEKYDVLILATGFGKEADTPGKDSPGYWESGKDRIDKIIDSEIKFCKEHIVSGTGDGGVIEALRLLFRNFRAGGVGPQGGGALVSPDIQRSVSNIETATRRHVFDHVIMDPTTEFEDLKSDLSEMLWKGYSEVLESGIVNAAFDRKVEKHLSGIKGIILTGRQSSPLSLDASPYHKFLITYAIHKGWVTYYQLEGTADVGDSLVDDRNAELAAEADVVRKKVSFKTKRIVESNGAGKFSRRKFTRKLSFDECFYLARHGYETPLSKINGLASGHDRDTLITAIKRSQVMFEENDQISREQMDFFADRLGEVSMANGKIWCAHHLEEANDYFSRMGLIVRSRGKKNASTEVRIEIDKPTALIKDRYFELNAIQGATDEERSQLAANPIPTSFYGAVVDRSNIRNIPTQTNVHGQE